MITIDLGTLEYYDSNEGKFIYEEGGVVSFEYSLKVIYEWEAKWKKPFLSGDLSEEESMDFYKRMALDPMEDRFMTVEVVEALSNYIKDTHTATIFTSNGDSQNGNKTSTRSKVYTSEELYALMFEANIPLEFESRSLNRLLVIMKIIASRNEKPKKMSRQDILKQNSEINRERRERYKTRG